MIDYDRHRWLSLILRVRGSVVPMLLPRMTIAAAIGATAAWLQKSRGVHIPPVAHTLIGVALGLLLVFRTNASYDRWWEGRRLLGVMVNRSRDLARQIASFLPGPENATVRADLARQLFAFYVLTTQALRFEDDLEKPMLTKHEREELASASQRPMRVITWISKRFATLAHEGQLTEPRLALLDANVTALVDALGGAERIVKTPIPFAYAQHIKLFVVLFVFSAPFAMADSMQWGTPVAAALLALALFGIDEIGVEIEDPFGYDDNDLPLDKIGQTIEKSVKELTA
jgi:ion channel-forming bestrophin family protein